jgi:nicotinate-nucleotide adenylyltransferase
MHIALFGGSFDPPHHGHQQVARYLLEQKVVDAVWFVPCCQHPFAKNMSPATDRLAMLRLLAVPGASISTFELEQPEPSFSLHTLRHYRQTQPDDLFSWVIGSDQLADFPRWHEYQQLLQEFKVYVYPRQSFPLTNLLPGMVPLVAAPEINISSTLIRASCQQGKPITDLVRPAIAEYIKTHHLYV